VEGVLLLTDEQWAVLEPLVEACRPPAKLPPQMFVRWSRLGRWERMLARILLPLVEAAQFRTGIAANSSCTMQV
jgi:transposase